MVLEHDDQDLGLAEEKEVALVEDSRHMPAMNDFASHVSRLAEFPSLLDFKIVCNGKEWPVHRAVLVLHSTVLAKSCAGQFEEAEQGRLDLSEEQISTVSALVHFMYHFNYDDSPDSRDTSDQQEGRLAFHVKVFLLANYLDIEGLKSLAAEKLAGNLSDHPDIDDYAVACTLAYEFRTITKPLCVSLVTYVVEHSTKRRGKDIPESEERPELKDRLEKLRKCMRDIPDFAVDVARGTWSILHAAEPDRISGYTCPECWARFWTDMANHQAEYYCPYCNMGQPGWRWAKDKTGKWLIINQETARDAVEQANWWRE